MALGCEISIRLTFGILNKFGVFHGHLGRVNEEVDFNACCGLEM